MLDAAVKALSQILSPPMRSILWRSIGLALVLITVLAIGLQRLSSWFATSGQGWAEAMLGPSFQTPLTILAWIVSIAAGLGVLFGAVLLMPAITSLVASVFVDEVGEHVEPNTIRRSPGTRAAVRARLTEGIKTAVLTLLVYSDALPFVFFAGLGVIIGCSSANSRTYWDANISSSPRCAFARPWKRRRCARRTARPSSLAG